MMVPYSEMEEIDKWALLRLNGLIRKVEDAFSRYEFHGFIHNVHGFCVLDMSNFYLDVAKTDCIPQRLMRKFADLVRLQCI